MEEVGTTKHIMYVLCSKSERKRGGEVDGTGRSKRGKSDRLLWDG
jgi:hypothetical protein